MTEEMKANDATRYLVIGMRNANTLENGFRALAAHDNPGDAQRDAEARALEDKEGGIYGVFQKVGTATSAWKVEWKGAAR